MRRPEGLVDSFFSLIVLPCTVLHILLSSGVSLDNYSYNGILAIWGDQIYFAIECCVLTLQLGDMAPQIGYLFRYPI